MTSTIIVGILRKQIYMAVSSNVTRSMTLKKNLVIDLNNGAII